MAKVVVAMSGGVDSSVAAALLQQQGHEVSGIFMKNWSPETLQSLTDCPWQEDQDDAAAVCEVLGIPFRSINFEKEYKERVVDYFLAEYAAGRTPNPDVMCNKEIKFKAFLAAATDLGADYMATGHYAQVEKIDGRYSLKRGLDPYKDQSYFLYTLGQDQLSRSLFPVGGMPKSRVRELAAEFKLPTATKKDSQGICFIGHIDLKKFLMEQIVAQPGYCYLLPEARPDLGLGQRQAAAQLVGKHQGAMFYTIGERAGSLVDNGLYRRLAEGADVPPLYVVEKDMEGNRLYLSDRRDDRDLFATNLIIEDWLGQLPESGRLSLQIRYQEKDPAPVVSWKRREDAKIEVITAQPVWAPAIGQAVVIYDGDQLVGGGILQAVNR